MKIIFLLILLSIGGAIQQCREQRPRNPKFHYYRVEGEYSGILPCRDCEALEMTFEIRRNQTYLITSRYMGREDNIQFESEGRFNWVEDGTLIHLLDNTDYPYARVMVDQVLLLGPDKKPFPGLDPRYFALTKNNQGAKWGPYK
jgi:copper homeostasis protein (lipoprotein)